MATAKAEQDETVDDAEATILSKRDLKKALSDANTEDERDREMTSMLLVELARSKAKALRARVIDFGDDRAELHAELDATRGEVSLLLAELLSEFKVTQAEVSFPDSQSSIMAEYVRSDIRRRSEEYEHSQYSQSGYMRTLSDVAVLFPGIDLLSLYQAP
ncbi:hypothetical protein ACLOJK_038171 [Asimina triloba]